MRLREAAGGHFLLDIYHSDIYSGDTWRRHYGRTIDSAWLSFEVQHDWIRSQEGFRDVVFVFFRAQLRVYLPEPEEDGDRGAISKQVEIQDGAPNRKVYTITEAGKRAFLEALRKPFVPDRPKNSLLMRLFFFTHLTPEERRAIILTQLESVERVRGELESIRPAVEARADRFQYLCFKIGLRHFENLAIDLSMVMEASEDESE